MTANYRLEAPAYGIVLEAERLRRDRNELIGELTVRCSLPGARTVNGTLSTGDFNFSSVRARQDRAKFFAQRASTNGEFDWFALLEEFCQRVFEAERAGEPAVDLRTLPRPDPDEILVEGLVFPKRHPSIIFGDGGSAKSLTALFLAGRLAQGGMVVALFDWELCGEDHRERLERLFSAGMPKILYCRCERPLITEADRLQRITRDERIEYAIFDSIAFACDGPPEAAEVASRYFRAVRQIGCGSLHVAHVTKSENNDQRPFGSAFWHNGARSTWYVQAAEPTDGTMRLGLFHRKANLGPLRPAVSYLINFLPNKTEFHQAGIAESPDLADKLSVRSRMILLLKRGSLTSNEIADHTGADLETVRRTARRYKNDFIALSGDRVGLCGQ